jgi:hypothetical protein
VAVLPQQLHVVQPQRLRLLLQLGLLARQPAVQCAAGRGERVSQRGLTPD